MKGLPLFTKGDYLSFHCKVSTKKGNGANSSVQIYFSGCGSCSALRPVLYTKAGSTYPRAL